ncbi:hypothetical protein O5340_02120 [Escherichia coli]|nr:hypothetical protein [Escherichia coli]
MAARAAQAHLYELGKHPDWQVLLTTHSPYFINPLEDHTTIARMQRSTDGNHFLHACMWLMKLTSHLMRKIIYRHYNLQILVLLKYFLGVIQLLLKVILNMRHLFQ